MSDVDDLIEEIRSYSWDAAYAHAFEFNLTHEDAVQEVEALIAKRIASMTAGKQGHD